MDEGQDPDRAAVLLGNQIEAGMGIGFRDDLLPAKQVAVSRVRVGAHVTVPGTDEARRPQGILRHEVCVVGIGSNVLEKRPRLLGILGRYINRVKVERLERDLVHR